MASTTRRPRTANRAAADEAKAFDFDAPQPRQPTTRTRKAPRPRRSIADVRREKREKFKQIIGPRVGKAIHDIRLLTHGANPKRYFYTEEDVEKLRTALLDEVEAALRPYAPPRSRPPGVEFD